MREIKFRGKVINYGYWVSGSYTGGPNGEYITTFYNDEWEDHQIEPLSVGQYTGLKDCDGVEIYEGDFVKELEGWREEFGQIAQVKFVKEDCAFMLVYPDGDYIPMGIERRFKVIGNIHDNPKMVKEGEQ